MSSLLMPSVLEHRMAYLHQFKCSNSEFQALLTSTESYIYYFNQIGEASHKYREHHIVDTSGIKVYLIDA